MTRRQRRSTFAMIGAGVVAVLALGTTITATTAGYTDTAQAETDPIEAEVKGEVRALQQSGALMTNAAVVEGQLYLWGYFGDGANPGGGTLGAGTGETKPPTLFKPLSEIVSVSATGYSFKAVTEDGNLWTWGRGVGANNPNGSLPGYVTDPWTPLDTQVTQVASSELTSAWLKENGTVWTVGSTDFGERGDGSAGPVQNPTRVIFPAGTSKIIKVGAATQGFFAVAEDLRVYYWGRNFRGGAGLASGVSEGANRTALEVPALTALAQSEGVAFLGGGWNWGALHTEAGNVYTWGSAANNANGHTPGNWTAAAGKDLYAPRLLLTGVTMLSASFQSGRALLEDGTVWAWGAHLNGGAMYDGGTLNSTNALAQVYDGLDGPAGSVGGGYGSGAYTLKLGDGSVWTWGNNDEGMSCGGLYGAWICPNQPIVGYVWPPYETEVP